MDFARKILLSYGWKEGDGLGRNKNGIVKPLKATLKFDNAGFGADNAAADFNNPWWERVFNEAASNVNIEKEDGHIKMVQKDKDAVEISTKGYSIKKLTKLKKNRKEYSKKKCTYGNFLQTATLTNIGSEIENPNKIDTSDIEVSKVKILTDEELFKACGGRTAHKGARHGLRLNGKLSRIEKQEAEFLDKMFKRKTLIQDEKHTNKLEPKNTEGRKSTEEKFNKHQDIYRIVNVKSDKVHKKKKRKYSDEKIQSSLTTS